MVSKGVNESAQASRNIMERITHVDQVLDQTAQGANQTQISSQELAKLAEQLREQLNQFRLEDGREECPSVRAADSATAGAPSGTDVVCAG